jgi:hypothetical protein
MISSADVLLVKLPKRASEFASDFLFTEWDKMPFSLRGRIWRQCVGSFSRASIHYCVVCPPICFVLYFVVGGKLAIIASLHVRRHFSTSVGPGEMALAPHLGALPVVMGSRSRLHLPNDLQFRLPRRHVFRTALQPAQHEFGSLSRCGRARARSELQTAYRHQPVCWILPAGKVSFSSV